MAQEIKQVLRPGVQSKGAAFEGLQGDRGVRGHSRVEASQKQEPHRAFLPTEVDFYSQEWDTVRSQERT